MFVKKIFICVQNCIKKEGLSLSLFNKPNDDIRMFINSLNRKLKKCFEPYNQLKEIQNKAKQMHFGDKIKDSKIRHKADEFLHVARIKYDILRKMHKAMKY